MFFLIAYTQNGIWCCVCIGMSSVQHNSKNRVKEIKKKLNVNRFKDNVILFLLFFFSFSDEFHFGLHSQPELNVFYDEHI